MSMWTAVAYQHIPHVHYFETFGKNFITFSLALLDIGYSAIAFLPLKQFGQLDIIGSDLLHFQFPSIILLVQYQIDAVALPIGFVFLQ